MEDEKPGSSASALTADLWALIHHDFSNEEIMNSMLVCKMWRDELPKTVTHISTTVAITQPTLSYISRTFTRLEELEINPEYDDHLPVLNFTRLRFPCLTSLTVHNSRLATCCFTTHNTPKLQLLNLEQMSGLRAFKLELPDLETLAFEFVTIDDCSRLGESLSACPKLVTLSSYKFWGPDDIYELSLPSCESLSLTRSDSLEGLRLWAPKLESLDLQGCFALRTVQLLDQPPAPPPQQQQQRGTLRESGATAAVAEAAPAPAGGTDGAGGEGPAGGGGGGGGGRGMRVNLVNTCASRATLQHLRQHPRVDRKRVFPPNSDPERAWEAVAFGGAGSGSGSDDGYSDDGEDEDEDEDEYGDFPGLFGEGHGGFGAGGMGIGGLGEMLHAMAAAAAAGGGGGPGGGPFGPFGGRGVGGGGAFGGGWGGTGFGPAPDEIWEDAEDEDEDEEDDTDGEEDEDEEGEDEEGGDGGEGAGRGVNLAELLRGGGPELLMQMLMAMQGGGGGGGGGGLFGAGMGRMGGVVGPAGGHRVVIREEGAEGEEESEEEGDEEGEDDEEEGGGEEGEDGDGEQAKGEAKKDR
ncbi:hypothetical protein GPECTOR_7g911 [Gonium pectorale]|uniref:F-box domain-containing protein n=1 Tax=Gonium pectorale TaxID=33097 RepID=A0A150GUG2_GONPE|nr:hypothetical protein GPECTOR_7g911 [Gonium pectorale]|eukprot:KXZ53461.1 hypothetical protein GPECTOR_7g911 [Gonium pectorale]